MKNRFILLFLSILLASAVYPRDPERGYRGFLDWDNAIGETDYLTRYQGYYGKGTLWFIGLATSHGYQLDSHWFLGGGIMLSCSCPRGEKFLPAFAEVRYDTKIGKFTPFIDFRGGYQYDGGKSGGIYMSPTVGYSFRGSAKLNFNFGIGMTVRGFTKEFLGTQGYLIWKNGQKTTNYTFVAARFGIDFR